MNIECEDRIDIYDLDLEKLSLESLESLLRLFTSCEGCHGCDSETKRLERAIEMKESE